MSKYKFEILAIDKNGDVVIENQNNFYYSLLANHQLWQEACIVKGIIKDKKQGITLGVNKIEVEDELQDSLKKTFVVQAQGPFEPIEEFRLKLLDYLRTLKFDNLYILKDEISMNIACSLYPGINQIETILRGYIMKFLITKLGPDWWDLTADAEMKKKTNQRKRNETVFSEYIDNRSYLIDFRELGRIIYSQSSGFLSKDDIIQRISTLEENPEAIKAFKKDIQSNYNKFFKEAFKDKDFQKKWEELEKIRHKVAHNNLFTISDQKRSYELFTQLEAIIKEADKSVHSITFNLAEKEAFVDRIVSFEDIDEGTLKYELSKSQSWAYRNAEGFVGLNSFVTNHLGGKGYRFQTSYEIIELLCDKGEIEKYSHITEGRKYPTTAIRLIGQNNSIGNTIGDFLKEQVINN